MSANKQKNAFALRCHEFGEKEQEFYAYAKQYFGSDHTFLVVNAEKKPKIPDTVSTIFFNNGKILSSQDYLWFDEVAWKCGDYCYYALHKELKGYDFIWLAEPDLKICHADPSSFFGEFERYSHDFLAPFLGPASEKLFFYPTAKCLEAPPMSCLFPITRLKTDKISRLGDIRKKLTKDFVSNNRPPQEYPNDEIFLATVTRRLGMKCAPLDKLSSANFMMFRSDKDTMFLDQDVEDVRGRFVMHPVLSEKEYLRKKERIFSSVLRSSKDLMLWVGDTLAKQPDVRIKKELQNRFLKELRKFLQIDQ